MWTCKRCETLNEDERDLCTLCGELKEVKAEQQRTSNSSQFTTDKRQFSHNQQSYGANNPQKNSEPRKKNHIAILIGVLSILLLAAVIAIVVLVSKQSVYRGVVQVTEPPASPMETIAPQINDAKQPTLSSFGDHQIVVDSMNLNESDVISWGAAIDANGTVWLWGQNDYVARPSDITDAAGIYTAGIDGAARLFVVKKDGSVWWAELYWENNTFNYEFQQISGLENITDLEIINAWYLGLFAIDNKGQIWAYGDGKYGVFGMGTDDDRFETPTAIQGLPPIQKIQCIYNDFEPGYSMVVAQAASGEFYYWGTNLFTNGSNEYCNTPASLALPTTSQNWSLFESVQIEKSVYFAWLDDKGHLSICENNMQPTDYSELGTFIYQHGGISGLYLLDENGSVYGYGYYASGVGLVEPAVRPTKLGVLKNNNSIISVNYGGWETTALYQNGRIGTWGQISIYVSQERLIQSEAGGDFNLAMNAAENTVEQNQNNGIKIGDVTLTVESTCDYSANLIPTNRDIQSNNYNFGGLTFDTNQINFEIIDDSLMIDCFGYLGVPVNGALVQLFNTTDQKKWQATMGEFQGVVIFDALTNGNYYYTVTCEGFDTYTSPEFKVEYSRGKDNDSAYMQCVLHPSDSAFSNGVVVQVTDIAGNLVTSKQMSEMVLQPCVKDGNSYHVWSGMSMGHSTNREGVVEAFEGFQFALRRGSMVLVTFDGITTWDGNDVKDHYILISAN